LVPQRIHDHRQSSELRLSRLVALHLRSSNNVFVWSLNYPLKSPVSFADDASLGEHEAKAKTKTKPELEPELILVVLEHQQLREAELEARFQPLQLSPMMMARPVHQ
jgi:hypothetical protein